MVLDESGPKVSTDCRGVIVNPPVIGVSSFSNQANVAGISVRHVSVADAPDRMV